MRRFAPLLVLAACGGGSTFTDAGPAGDALAPDAAAGAVDAPAPADAAALCPVPSGFTRLGAVTSGGSSRVISIGLSTDPANMDGDVGTVDLPLEDITNASGTGWVGVAAGTLYALTPPDTVGGAFTHTTLGAAPGITALSADGLLGLYGAAGTALYHFTVSPYAMTQVTTITEAGCSGIADFGLESSGGQAIYDVVLDCTGGDRYEQLLDDGAGNLTVIQGPGAPGPTDMAGYAEIGWAVSESAVYQLQGTSFVEIRPLSSCLGLAAGEVRGLQ